MRTLFFSIVIILLVFGSQHVDGFGFSNRLLERVGASGMRAGGARDLSMKWLFSKGAGSLVDMGGIGGQGEYYYIQSKRPTLKVPESAASALGKEKNIPIFPRNQVSINLLSFAFCLLPSAYCLLPSAFPFVLLTSPLFLILCSASFRCLPRWEKSIWVCTRCGTVSFCTMWVRAGFSGTFTTARRTRS